MSNRVDDTNGEWSQLVTEGHVLGARIRWVQPWLIGTGVLCLILGFYLWSIMDVGPQERAAPDFQSEINQAREPVVAAVTNMPSLNVRSDEGPNLSSATELKDLIPLILKSLDGTGKLPAGQIAVRSVSPDAFWRKEWPHNTLITVDREELKLVAGVVNTASPDSWPSPARWLGIFRKHDGKWQYASAEGREFVTVGDYPDVPPEDIPLTLKPALPGGAE